MGIMPVSSDAVTPSRLLGRVGMPAWLAGMG